MEDTMDFSRMLETMKGHSDYHKMGMVASHIGVVRENSLKGGKVDEIELSFDQDAIQEIILEAKKSPGIIEVLVETKDGCLKVGEEIMAVFVGGDTRDHVFPVLIETVDQMKKKASHKKEIFAEEN
jgi:molybdopterin synthase catalytic subunit